MSSQPLQQFPSSSSHACSSPSFPLSAFPNPCQSASSSSCPPLPPPLPFPSSISSLIPDPLARMLQQQQQLLHQQNHNNHHNHHHHHPHNHNQQQQHEQDSPQKAFVCEICGKAFRFRSNLAEHRSVHTAVKPFVCKFCGKSSRLKGNLTKHILKHHKSEQRDYIGTEEYIIKKGKKAVKDPAAIEFLEKSMIVLNNNNNNDNNGHNSNGNISSTGTGAEQSPATVEEEMSNAGGGGGDPIFDLNSQPATAAQNLLLSLGFDGINLDLKREAFSPADNGGDPFAAFFSQNATNVNVEEEGMEAEGSEGKLEEEEEEEEEENESRQSSSADQQQQQGSPQMVDHHQQQNGTAANAALAAAACKAFLRQIPQIVDGKQLAKVLFGGATKPTTVAPDDQMEMDGNWAIKEGGQGQPLQQPQQVNDEEVMRLLATFGGGGATAGTPQKRHDNEPTKQQKQQQQQQQQQLAMNGIGGGGVCRMATQCQQCGKHFRKPRDLTAHLSSAHKKASASSFSSTSSCVPLLPSRGANAAAGALPIGTFSAAVFPSSASSISVPNSSANDFAASSSFPPITSRNKSTANASSSSRDEAVLQELRQLRSTLAEMKAAGGMGGNGIGRVEQQLALLDQRVCRLEKQLEMALNSIYTLVQLQTGINNNVSKLSRTMMNNSQGHSQ